MANWPSTSGDFAARTHVRVNNPFVPSTNAFQEIGRSAERATQEMNLLFESSYETKVDRIVEEAMRAGVSDEAIGEIVSEVTRESVREDLSEDETIRRMARRLQEARDRVRHGVTYDTDGDAAEMEVREFVERVSPRGEVSWTEATQAFIGRHSDHRALCDRLDTSRRGGRITVEVRPSTKAGTGVLTSTLHQDEVAASLLTGAPVRFRVVEEVSRRHVKGFLKRPLV